MRYVPELRLSRRRKEHMKMQMWLVERGASNFDKHPDPTSIEASKSWKPKGQYSLSLQVTLYGC